MFFHSIRFKVYKDWLSGDNLFYFYNFTILPYELSAKFCLGKKMINQSLISPLKQKINLQASLFIK